MNTHTNSTMRRARPSPTAPRPAPAAPAHARPQSPVIRPRSICLPLRAGAAASALLLAVSSASAQFTISTGTGPFVPSFRDTVSPFDENNTTWFGWASGTFDGSPDNELVDNPAVTLGLGGLDGTLSQFGTDDILSSSNSIYTSSFTPITLSLAIPTHGTVGTGFTTIIVQGRTAFGSYPGEEAFDFPDLGGDEAEVVVGTNGLSQGQFWAKYEIAGNAESYTLDFDLVGGFVSIATLTVDTQWSEAQHAPDTVQAVPEPSTAITVAGGAALLGLVRRRRTV